GIIKRPNPKAMGEYKRRKPHRPGLIEHEFGGAGEVQWHQKLKSWPSALGDLYQPTCLDEIFRGGVGEVKTLPGLLSQASISIDTRTDMRRLEALFGMERHWFPKNLPNQQLGRKTLYDYHAVAEIMDVSLNGATRLVRKKLLRKVWLDKSELRAHVLRGIQERMNTISAPKHVQRVFLKIIRRHLADSGKS